MRKKLVFAVTGILLLTFTTNSVMAETYQETVPMEMHPEQSLYMMKTVIQPF